MEKYNKMSLEDKKKSTLVHLVRASIQLSTIWTLYNFFVAMELSYLHSKMAQKTPKNLALKYHLDLS